MDREYSGFGRDSESVFIEKRGNRKSARSMKSESQHEFRVVDGRAASGMHVIAEVDLCPDVAREP
jgi:hypothetical protein